MQAEEGNPTSNAKLLWHALSAGNYDLMLRLLAEGVDPNKQYTDSPGGGRYFTLAHLATTKSEEDCKKQIELLVKARANVDGRDSNGDTPLHYLIKTGMKFADETRALTVGHKIAHLLSAKANCDIPNNTGNTAIYTLVKLATRQGYLGPVADPLIKQLVQAKADLEKGAQSPLQCACFMGRPRLSLVELLLKSRAQIDFGKDTLEKTLEKIPNKVIPFGSLPIDHDPEVAFWKRPIDEANKVVQCLAYYHLGRWNETSHQKFPADLRAQTLAIFIAIRHMLPQEPCRLVSLLTRAIDAKARNRAFELQL